MHSFNIYDAMKAKYPNSYPADIIHVKWKNLGISEKTIYSIHQGDIAGLDMFEVATLCNELGIRIEDVLKSKRLPTPSSASRNYVHNCVYFFERQNGDIKIGKTTHLKNRWRILQNEHGDLNLLLHVSGYTRLEQTYHYYFDWCRQDGEWFSPVKALIDYIEWCTRFINYNHTIREGLPSRSLWKWESKGGTIEHEKID